MKKKAKIAFCSVNPAIKAGFEMMRMDTYFKIYPDEGKAIEGI